jgi:hypothetical protein
MPASATDDDGGISHPQGFGSKLRQVDVSEVTTASKHDPLSYACIMSFQDLAHLIPDNVPFVLETPVEISGMAAEMKKVRHALPANAAMVA